jgi:hypothetical protein
MHNNDLLSKVNNQQNKRLEPRMCYSVAGVNNPKNNSKKVETATKRNNAKINSKNDDAIKIKQKNDQLMLNRIRIIDDRKSRKIIKKYESFYRMQAFLFPSFLKILSL